jgi:hypothetical protein
LALPVVERGDERLEDLPPFGPFHRGADRKAVEHRRRSPEMTTASWAMSAGRKGQSDRGARMGVAFHVIGVDIDDAGDEERAAEVETEGRHRGEIAAMRPSDISSPPSDTPPGVTIRAFFRARWRCGGSSNMAGVLLLRLHPLRLQDVTRE